MAAHRAAGAASISASAPPALSGGRVPAAATAQNAKYRLRYGTAFPADHPGVKRIQEAGAAIAKDTGGQVDLQVYPNSQLGSEPDMFSQIRSGALDFMSTSGVNQTVVPVGGINAVAFAFESYDKVWAAMDGELGNHVRAPVRQGRACTSCPRCSTTATATSPPRPSRSTRRPTSRASRSGCPATSSG